MFGKKETIAEEFERALEEPNFKEKTGKKGNQNIRCDLKRPQTTYNDLKQKWRKVTDKKVWFWFNWQKGSRMI